MMKTKWISPVLVTAMAVGLGALYLGRAPEAAAAAAGLFRIGCNYSHSNTDDMIVFPGKPGASHMHDYFGNAAANATATYDSMRSAPTSCPGGDSAAYWVPALFQNGKRIVPSGMSTYYTTPVDPDVTKIQAFPPNFRMIIGDAKNADPANVGRIQWGCTDNTNISKVPPTRCAARDHIQVRITFPSCWNGTKTEGNAVPNMDFPRSGRCPAGFDIPLPALRVNVLYKTGNDVGNITLSSGNINSAHADFVNTFAQPTLQELVDRCLNGKVNCPIVRP